MCIGNARSQINLPVGSRFVERRQAEVAANNGQPPRRAIRAAAAAFHNRSPTGTSGGVTGG